MATVAGIETGKSGDEGVDFIQDYHNGSNMIYLIEYFK